MYISIGWLVLFDCGDHLTVYLRRCGWTLRCRPGAAATQFKVPFTEHRKNPNAEGDRVMEHIHLYIFGKCQKMAGLQRRKRERFSFESGASAVWRMKAARHLCAKCCFCWG